MWCFYNNQRKKKKEEKENKHAKLMLSKKFSVRSNRKKIKRSRLGKRFLSRSFLCQTPGLYLKQEMEEEKEKLTE